MKIQGSPPSWIGSNTRLKEWYIYAIGYVPPNWRTRPPVMCDSDLLDCMRTEKSYKENLLADQQWKNIRRDLRFLGIISEEFAGHFPERIRCV